MTGAQSIPPANPAVSAQSSQAWATEGVSVQSGVMSNFAQFDTNRDGMLTQSEVVTAMDSGTLPEGLGGFALAVMKYDGADGSVADGDLSDAEIAMIPETELSAEAKSALLTFLDQARVAPGTPGATVATTLPVQPTQTTTM